MIVSSHLPSGAPIRSSRYSVMAVECVDDLDYWRGVRTVWVSDAMLVNVEHDVEFTDDLAQKLVDCPDDACTYAYTLYWASTHQPAHYAQRHGRRAGAWVRNGEQWCDYTGIGFCKLTAEARVRPLEESHWSHVDMAVTDAIDARWHIHWPPVDHRHL